MPYDAGAYATSGVLCAQCAARVCADTAGRTTSQLMVHRHMACLAPVRSVGLASHGHARLGHRPSRRGVVVDHHRRSGASLSGSSVSLAEKTMEETIKIAKEINSGGQPSRKMKMSSTTKLYSLCFKL
jgi:hypothetical protein